MIEQSIVAAIGPLFTGRVFPDTAPFDTPRPWATYTQVGGEEVNFVDKADPGIRNARMQINIWANTRAQATTLAKQVVAALRAATEMEATPDGAFHARHEPDLGLYGTEQDFSCWKHE